MLFNTGSSNFVVFVREGMYCLWCYVCVVLNGMDVKFVFLSVSV